ncbi:LuxR family transcriptional regulator [Nocardiopsis ansamitocini]|uniref:Helix-turn-helix transcriptional regulator n=1 Tax=Nocardiopsis ansamitocini TaxID=1670832 RepID=A0A9W6P8A7_9ACTN|nr:LuxR family transcriptional regulator [Nocardiopsis ansamitocini]GLU48847.1 helix-turn-helix transcriptional regulator [Nocardiopsis ansamitocini]
MTVSATHAQEGAAIRGAVLALRRHTGVHMAFGGPMTGRGQLRLTELSGERGDALRGLAITVGAGLGGKSIALARPFAVNDYSSARSISHEYDRPVGAERLRSIIAVPVVVRGRVRAVLYGALRHSVPLGDRTIASALRVARGLEQDLVVRDEAGRLTREAGTPAHQGSTGWEQVRCAHAELRALVQRADDPQLRQSLRDVCDRLAGAADPRAPESAPRLAPRELDVLACVAMGASNAEAARRLGIGAETVKGYLRTAMRKLDSSTRLEAVVAARRAGLLP